MLTQYLSLHLLLVPFATAHFLLNNPKSIGFSDDAEAEYPCGGQDITDRKTVTNFPISGLPISVTTTHPEDVWYYRAALLNDTETWVDLSPAIQQSGPGDFCVPNIKGLAQWVGKDAVLQVVTNAPDGYLFECAAIKFVDGPATAPQGNCKNGTGVEATFSDAELVLNASVTSLASGPEATQTGTSSTDHDEHAGHTTTTTGATTSQTPNSALKRDSGSMVGMLGAAGVVGLALI